MQRTPYGRVEVNEYGQTFVRGSENELYRWATRPNERWPCSTLRTLRRIWAEFDAHGDLVDIYHPGASDVDGNEFSAWASDVLRAAGHVNHPAIR